MIHILFGINFPQNVSIGIKIHENITRYSESFSI